MTRFRIQLCWKSCKTLQHFLSSIILLGIILIKSKLYPTLVGAKYVGRNISKTSASVSSGVPNTEKQMKARGRRWSAFIVSRCLEPLMKHEARVFWYSFLNELPTIIVCYFCFVLLMKQ